MEGKISLFLASHGANDSIGAIGSSSVSEKLFDGRLPANGVELAERISGDTTIGHALAYCQALESLAEMEVPSRARYLRVILLETERLYNHITDFGAIANDNGFAIANAYCSCPREQLLRLNKIQKSPYAAKTV